MNFANEISYHSLTQAAEVLSLKVASTRTITNQTHTNDDGRRWLRYDDGDENGSDAGRERKKKTTGTNYCRPNWPAIVVLVGQRKSWIQGLVFVFRLFRHFPSFSVPGNDNQIWGLIWDRKVWCWSASMVSSIERQIVFWNFGRPYQLTLWDWGYRFQLLLAGGLATAPCFCGKLLAMISDYFLFLQFWMVNSISTYSYVSKTFDAASVHT